MSLIVAKEVGASGASTLNSWGKKQIDNFRTGLQGNLGRGALRVAGVNKLDSYIKSTRLGNTAIGAGLRNMTTGALTKQKFGSKSSIEDVNKREDKRKDKLADIKEEVVKAQYGKAGERVASAQKKEQEIKDKIKEKQDADSGVKGARDDEKIQKDALQKAQEAVKQKEAEIKANPRALDIMTKQADLARLKADETLHSNALKTVEQARIKEEARVRTPFRKDLKQATRATGIAEQQKTKMGTSEKDYLKNVADEMENPKTTFGKIKRIGRRLTGLPVPLLIAGGLMGGGIPNLVIGGAAAAAVATLNQQARKARRETIKALRDASQGKKKKKGSGKATTADNVDVDEFDDDELDKLEKKIAAAKK